MSPIAHLWQSTLCAAVAAIVISLLRRAPARYRHAVWMLAAIKFLVPFSLLVAIGGALAVWLTPPDLRLGPWIDRSIPFFTLRAGVTSPSPSPVMNLLGPALSIVWIAGAAWVAVWRVREWRHASALVRNTVRLVSGREVDALARAAQTLRCTRRIGVREGDSNLEPSVLGVFTPSIVWPSGLSERLSDEEMDAIFAHEIAHINRHDNLFARVQIAAETLFWFYPVIWWLSKRIVNERERACDEEVVQMGTDTQSYAAGILKVCGFCLRAPATFAAGVGGSDLTKRVERIMSPSTSGGSAGGARFAQVLGLAFGIAMTATPLGLGALGVATPQAPTVYGSKQAGIVTPRVVKETKPRYTREAMRAGIQGVVKLEAVVLADGKVSDVKVTESLDKEFGLDEQAVEAMKKWEFTPGTKDGKPVAVRIEVEMSFKLK